MKLNNPDFSAFDQLPHVADWPDLRSIWSRAAQQCSPAWRLPALACQAVGGLRDQAVLATTAIASAQVGIILIDDILDDDPRGEQHNRGLQPVPNLASAFLALGLEAVAADNYLLATEKKLLAVSSLNRMILTTARGQALDAAGIADETAYWQVVAMKSAPFFGMAFYLGALSGGASLELADRLRLIGQVYGEMIQIHDDLRDSLATPASADWALGRTSLPILFAEVVTHPEQTRFRQLRASLTSTEALAEAQAILARCGAISFGVDQLLARYEQGLALTANLPADCQLQIELLLEELVEPVRKLLQSVM
jgi:geranylgeranyl pyrophosphate synthase